MVGRARSIANTVAKLTVLVYSVAAARTVADLQRTPPALGVAIEIDSDGRRAGLKPDDPSVVDIAEILEGAPAVRFWGVVTHAGGSYDCIDEDGLRRMADKIGRASRRERVCR